MNTKEKLVWAFKPALFFSGFILDLYIPKVIGIK